jgi:hypothetical protein
MEPIDAVFYSPQKLAAARAETAREHSEKAAKKVRMKSIQELKRLKKKCFIQVPESRSVWRERKAEGGEREEGRQSY